MVGGELADVLKYILGMFVGDAKEFLETREPKEGFVRFLGATSVNRIVKRTGYLRESTYRLVRTLYGSAVRASEFKELCHKQGCRMPLQSWQCRDCCKYDAFPTRVANSELAELCEEGKAHGNIYCGLDLSKLIGMYKRKVSEDNELVRVVVGLKEKVREYRGASSAES